MLSHHHPLPSPPQPHLAGHRCGVLCYSESQAGTEQLQHPQEPQQPQQPQQPLKPQQQPSPQPMTLANPPSPPHPSPDPVPRGLSTPTLDPDLRVLQHHYTTRHQPSLLHPVHYTTLHHTTLQENALHCSPQRNIPGLWTLHLSLAPMATKKTASWDPEALHTPLLQTTNQVRTLALDSDS